MAVILTGRLLIDLPFSVIAIEPSVNAGDKMHRYGGVKMHQ